MQSVVVLSYLKLCLLVAISVADSRSNEGHIVELGERENDAIDDNENNDVDLEDEEQANAVDDAVDDVKLEDAATNDPTNMQNQDESGEPRDIQGANQPAVSGETKDDEQADVSANVPSDVGENKVQGETEESINTNEQDDAAMPEENIDGNKKSNQDKTYDLPSYNPSGWARLDKTLAIPAFELSATEMDKFKIWPEAKVPYLIDELSYDKGLRDRIRSYLDEVQQKTQVHFHELPEPPSDENDRWVLFVNRRGTLDCKDYSTKSFTNSGVQKVIVGYDCLRHGGPMAGIVLALLGVPPQHNSPDRDQYIVVDKEHILPEKKGLFKRLSNDEWLFHDLAYDYDSASHYPPHKYTADGSPTIKLKEDNKKKLKGPYQLPPKIMYYEEVTTYSPHDIQKIAMLYNGIIHKRAEKGIKHEDCKVLYKPGPVVKKTKLKSRVKFHVRPKPKLYLSAIKKPKDVEGEELSSLESRKMIT